MDCDEGYVMLDSRVGEDVIIFWWVVANLREISWYCSTTCAELWGGGGGGGNPIWKVDEEGEMALLLGKGVKGICN